MDLNDTPAQVRYRAKVRAWLDEHKAEAPPEQGGDDDAAYIDARRAWQGKLAAAGLAGVTWPVELGGQGLGPIEHVIVGQEINRVGVPNVLDVIGVGMLGPTIIAHGTDEQKNRYLGPMLHGDEVWCQLFSEPAAGSDLAAVQARAVLQEDGSWRLSGQKVWTTAAHFAAHGLLLARTDADVPKHKGLTMFIVPMKAEGVTIRGLRQISGEAEFNEVFFDDVRLEADAVVGGVGNGWGTALTTLMFERMTIGLGSESMGYRPERYAAAIASDEHARLDPEVRRRLGELSVELLAVKFTGYRMLSLLQHGQIPGPEAGLAKVTTVRSAIEAGDLVADVLGPEALAEGSEWAYTISYLPGLKSAGGTEEILRNTIGERVLGLPPEPRLDKGIPFSELREGARGGGCAMNLELTDEQTFLREAAREALSRVKTVAAARDALENPAALPDLWPIAREAGWAGLLVSEDNGGAGLSAFDAMLVMSEAGRVLAGVQLLGHLPASALLDCAADERIGAIAEGELRACLVPASPPGDLEDRWTVEPPSGSVRLPAPLLGADGMLHGSVAWVPDAPGAGLYVVVATREQDGAPVAVVVDAVDADVEEAVRYDATRSLGHVRFDGVAAGVLEGVAGGEIARAWYLAQSLLAAESLGAVETALAASVAYAKERFTFGRAIGSYQAVKHSLVEVLRLRENTYALLLYAGWAYEDKPDEFALAASAARSSGGHALDYASRAMISVHGGIGATWEHDAPLFFRRAQLSRRLLGGVGNATDRVAGELLSAA